MKIVEAITDCRGIHAGEVSNISPVFLYPGEGSSSGNDTGQDHAYQQKQSHVFVHDQGRSKRGYIALMSRVKGLDICVGDLVQFVRGEHAGRAGEVIGIQVSKAHDRLIYTIKLSDYKSTVAGALCFDVIKEAGA